MSIQRLLAASLLLACLVSCGGGSSSAPPTLSSACEQNVCVFTYPTTGGFFTGHWHINGADVGLRNSPFTVLFQKSGSYTVSLTQPSSGLSTQQQVTISQLAELQYEVQTSLQMVLMADRNAKLLNDLSGQVVPLIEAQEARNGQLKQDTLPCAGGGSLDYNVLHAADSTNLQPGDDFLLAPSGTTHGNEQACIMSPGASPLLGDKVEDIFADVTYGTQASGIPMQLQVGVADIGGQPWWSMEDMYFSFVPSGSTLNVTVATPGGTTSGRWIYVPSNWAWDTYFEGGGTYLQVSNFQMSTDAADTHAISASMVWEPTFAGGEIAGPPVQVAVTAPLDISSDAQGLRMLAGSMTITNYTNDTQLAANNPSSAVTISVPAGADPTELQVSAKDFSSGGATIKGTYEQKGIVSYPHNCATGESIAYCIGSTFTYEAVYVF